MISVLDVRLGPDTIVVGHGGVGNEVWVAVEHVAEAFGWSVTDLGGAEIGLCPDPDTCVPVPSAATRSDDGRARVDLAALADPLGLAVARRGGRAAVVAGGRGSVGGRAASAHGLVLPDARTGLPTALVEEGRRTCVFAWASW